MPVPEWRIVGDWFDVCKCTIPCPCTFAQAPTTGGCEGIPATIFSGPECGTGSVATWARATVDEADAFEFKFDWAGKSSKHMAFDWSGPS
jgi:hypothetical protein